MDGKALIASLLEIAFIVRKNIDYFINTVYKMLVFYEYLYIDYQILDGLQNEKV